MKKARKLTRQAQYSATCTEARLSAERKRKWCGCVKIALDRMDFTHSSARPLDPVNVARLVASFELGGCYRTDVAYHVPGVLDVDLLHQSVIHAGASMNDLRSKDASVWPRLELPAGVQVRCLHGQHRVAAARQFLRGQDQWWVVDIFADTISVDLCRSLAEQTANEVPLSAGQIYFHMLRCRPDDEEAINAWRSQIQTPHAAEKVKQLFGRARLSAAFREVAKIPAFGAFMQAGNTDALLGMKCDEEVVHYLARIPATWSFLVGGEAMLHKIDRSTIEALQLRCPANCTRDREVLEPLVNQGTIFAAFDERKRREIWQSLLVFHRRVPSLYAFFEDVKYLRDVARCMTWLVRPSRRQTVRQACRTAFALPAAGFDRAYQELWIVLMRELRSLRPETGRVERKEYRETQGKNLHVEYDTARRAHDLGFRSDQIDVLLEEHPDRKVARAALLRARRPSKYIHSEAAIEACVNDMVAIFNRVRERDTDPPAIPTLIVPGDGEYDDKRRCGRPHTLAARDSDRYLTFEHLQIPDCEEVGGLSAFNIQRDVFLSFFDALADQPRAASVHSGAISAADRVQDHVDHIVVAIERELDQQLLDRRELQSVTSSPATEQDPGLDTRVNDADVEMLSEYTDATVTPDVEDEIAFIPEVVRFVDLQGNLLEEVLVEPAREDRVEATASRYISQGFFLHDRQSRGVYSAFCLAAAREHEDQAIVVAPPHHLNRRKRVYDEISSDWNHPHESRDSPSRPSKRTNRQTTPD